MTYNFLVMFNSNYGSILHHFDIFGFKTQNYEFICNTLEVQNVAFRRSQKFSDTVRALQFFIYNCWSSVGHTNDCFIRTWHMSIRCTDVFVSNLFNRSIKSFLPGKCC